MEGRVNPFGEGKSWTYYMPEPDYNADVAWLRKKLKTTGGNIYFSSGEANYQAYSQLMDEIRFAHDEYDARIQAVAGPIISIPEHPRAEKNQAGRENLSPIVRLAKEGKILLYPADKRLSHTFMIFSDIEAAKIEETHAPGEKPKASKYIYNQWIEYAPYETLFSLATLWKNPVTKDYTDHFLFLTDSEIRELRKWASRKNKDINKIDIESCREFWREYTQ